MAAKQEPDSKVAGETKLDEIDRGDKTCFLTVEIENNLPSVEECL